MKKPLSNIPKSTAMRTLTAIIGFLLPHFLCVAQESNTSGTGTGHQPNDSIHAIMPLSDSGEESFFRGVIPPSPNAAALARYAEYPVSHTTGVPDISIPLYEIQMGDFVLPISISYHASGTKSDQIPTCVGLGWSLNAGGAISRTILGKPDMFNYAAGSDDYTYHDEGKLREMLGEVSQTGGGQNGHILSSILHSSTDWDTESDRYTFNIAGRSGVFRYSHADGRFIILNNSNDAISATGKSNGGGISFRMYSTDGTTYEFAQEESSGVADEYREDAFVTTWYVTRISTLRGDISFTYEHAPSLSVHGFDVQATAGLRYDYVETESGDWYYEQKYRLSATNSDVFYHYGQKLLKKIEFNGNYIHFNYVDDCQGQTMRRLTSMEVYNSSGDLRKRVTFDNTDNWPTGNALSGRRLLQSVSDTENGTWTFEYNKDTKLPALPLVYSSACDSDYWGFMNSGKASTYNSVFTESQYDWLMAGLREDFNLDDSHKDSRIFTRSRDAVLLYARAGVLKKITLPTGADISFDFELNRLSGHNVGGLRIKAMTVHDPHSAETNRTTFEYSGARDTHEEPELLMRYYTHEQQNKKNDYGAFPPTRFRTVSSYPILPVTSTCPPVMYSQVTEIHGDGSRTSYCYDDTEFGHLTGTSPYYTHPSLWDQSVMDFGAWDAPLKSKTYTDSSGKDIYKETYTYTKKNLKTFSTGVRTFWKYISYNIPSTSMWETASSPTADIARYGLMEYRTSYAYTRAVTLTSKKKEDLVTGFTTTTEYGYDDKYRTFLPTAMSVTNSDNSVTRTEYKYPFNFSDATSADMTDMGIVDLPVSVDVSVNNRTVSSKKTEYALFNDMYYPVATRSWSMPTSDGATAIPAALPERERVSSYNTLGRPASITVNATDVTSFAWDTHGQLLSATAPGGLATTYTHTPLFGVESVTEPNGHTTRYDYNAMGLLMRVLDQNQITDSYSYTLINHPTGDFKAAYNSVISRHYLETTGTQRTIDRQFCDGLGRPSVLAKAGMNTSCKYLYTAQTYDALGRELRSVMPGVGDKTVEAMTAVQVLAAATSTHGDPYAYSETAYDALDRPLKTTTPGTAWHDNGVRGNVTEYVGNKAGSVRRYRAPVTSITLVEDGYHAASTLRGVRSVDEDGNEMTVYSDRLGRKVLERRGPESGKGQNDTYFVYNDLGQLRYVLSPGYELSGYKEKFAYEYRYDDSGNIVKKFMPGGGYTQYWYDRAGRMAFMQDPGLREQGLHRFFLYDKAGRQVIQGLSSSCNRSGAVNFATYTGSTSGFQSTGYTLTDASRIQQATLESVSYYDDYTFVSPLDSRLAASNTSVTSAKGLATGSVTYNSEGGRSMSAMYYDIRGNVTQLREVSDFGTLRVTDNTYTFTNQTLTSKTTEESGEKTKTTLLTENTYHAETGLLLHTDVTVNGTKQRVSSLTYDDLGRVVSITRGGDTGKGGTVVYAYNLHGQATSISGPGFSQSLHYTDGPGKPLYNGSVSSMTWTMHDHRERGYKYTYNGYGWLTLAEYAEGASLSSNKDRYTERFINFMPNGGIRRLQRHGLKADGNYGKIDNLHISYDGNRITTVLEDAADVTTTGSMDNPGKQREMEFGYNEWGALTKDESRGITNIEYDNFGNPTRISFSNGSYTKNVYSASGVKLKTEHYSSLGSGVNAIASAMDMDDDADADVAASADAANAISGMERIEYHGPVIYRNGSIDMVQFPGGYATISGSNVTFHYYTQDYLGNNRAVVNGTTGAIEQTTAYYPYGAVIADLGTGNSGQPFKFIGKELISANGLNVYDHGARLHYPAIPQFDRIDPLCEKYPWLSPYLYCANNPINLIDLDGLKPNEYESALICGYVYHDENFEYYKQKLDNTDWKLSSKKVKIDKNKTGMFENGLQSELFERTIDGVTEYVYAFAGTNSVEDVLEDIGQIFGIAPQYSNAIKNAEVLSEELGSLELTFVGHSLGGGLAAASSMATGRNAITFNRATVSNLTSIFHNLGDVNHVKDYVVVNQNSQNGHIKEEPLTRFQKSLLFQTKARQVQILVKDMKHINTHSINTIVRALEQRIK